MDEPSWLSLKFHIDQGLIVRFEDYFDTASAQTHIQEFKEQLHLAGTSEEPVDES